MKLCTTLRVKSFERDKDGNLVITGADFGDISLVSDDHRFGLHEHPFREDSAPVLHLEGSVVDQEAQAS